MKYLSPIQAQKMYGYHPKTLANWADEGKIEYIRTPGGQRRYLASSLSSRVQAKPEEKTILYCRVSTHSQKDDLDTQVIELSKRAPDAEVIREIGSGMNFKRRKFMALMQRVAEGEVSQIVIGHKDRLCRFGFDFVEWFCQLNGCKITVLGKTELSPHQELMQDFMSIMHCFSSKLYFLRKYKEKLLDDFAKTESNGV
ncbi:IS607 family transposase [Aetokthonos hydrillicola Thurmond2011]|jgi:predicted site-specific integrase-resolvase|uniref:IS607 family transposase n=1 Tax=Aetokthonos hydrillicola Thurmond2011 TaxID=2712845 RepID=A0AAP5I5Y7_9CYAN|nr:IS607 family transposase [Aetokthonos hydrillicola]MBO3460496.1 IS607 family transposase [Aetokthonos hydrillicola CCALA 1050]MBW4588216.1 IS607 family transposase [Aetokthonos hydrillicola CCALA 1050]MDR9893100.1 IS607 family transposase [Aetokthonos hydrillicola Thurmond2011]